MLYFIVASHFIKSVIVICFCFTVCLCVIFSIILTAFVQFHSIFKSYVVIVFSCLPEKDIMYPLMLVM